MRTGEVIEAQLGMLLPFFADCGTMPDRPPFDF